MSVELPATRNWEISNYVNGVWTKGGGEAVDIHSPYTGKSLGKVFYSNESDIDKVVSAADKAQKVWATFPLKARAQVLFNFRDTLLRDQDEISAVVANENGKTIEEARAGLLKGVEVLEYALSLQNADVGGKMEVSRGVFCEYRREPLGVVASVTPFNFPAMVPLWTIPIAIALGNAYVWKPSEKTPITSQYIANAFKEAGLPDGILSVVQGDHVAVNALIDHKDVKAIAFVGSTKVAKIVYQRATSHGKRCLALGGAKNHIVVLPDADPGISGCGISDSFTGCAGQRCMAASVILAVGEVDHILEGIKARSESQVLGKTMGAIITKEQVEFLNTSIEKAVSEGATLVLDGRQPNVDGGFKEGYWVGPTILDNVRPGSHAHQVELFGPIISIIRCKNITEAMEIQNSSEYGNACSVFTTSGPMAEKVATMAQCGMFGVNVGVPVPREPFSFGGVKSSKFGHGDITGEHSLDFWTNVKKITTKWEMQSDNNWMS